MAPDAVLLDAGGVFVLPESRRIVDAFARAECEVAAGLLIEAHYRAATTFTTDIDVTADWASCWMRYLRVYLDVCGVPDDLVEEAHRHVDSEFADAGLWVEPVAGSKEGLAALVDTGVRVGIVSNADGLIGQRLAAMEICQVGPGLGVELECVIDSGNVGIMKPDARIFQAALDVMGVVAERTWYVGDMPAIDVVGARRAGLRPFVMDPFELHVHADYDRVPDLHGLAVSIAG
jgi:putative hydrolase of the HAD superfamily